jgi:hypothetical protein
MASRSLTSSSSNCPMIRASIDMPTPMTLCALSSPCRSSRVTKSLLEPNFSKLSVRALWYSATKSSHRCSTRAISTQAYKKNDKSVARVVYLASWKSIIIVFSGLPPSYLIKKLGGQTSPWVTTEKRFLTRHDSISTPYKSFSINLFNLSKYSLGSSFSTASLIIAKTRCWKLLYHGRNLSEKYVSCKHLVNSGKLQMFYLLLELWQLFRSFLVVGP